MSSQRIQVQDWFSQFVGFLDNAAKTVEADIVAVANAIGPDIVIYAEDFLSSLAQIAIGAVLKQAPLVISGAEKFGSAVTSVIQQVEAQGKTLALNDAHAVVQSAYNKVAALAAAKSGK